MDKRGKLTTQSINTAIIGIVLIVVLFKLYASLIPEAQDAGDELETAGVPLGSLFAGSGVVFIILMAGLVIVIVKSVMPSNK
jgi:hypothetical protein